MATAKKRGSSWRVRVYDKITGKYKSFTAPTKNEAERLGNEYLERKKVTNLSEITIEQAINNYIESKNNILSPSSIRGYEIIKKNAIEEIKNIKLSKINEIVLQRWINNNALRYSPKTIRNQYGFIKVVLRQNKIKLNFEDIMLKPMVKKEMVIPNEEQMAEILHIVENTNVELPVTMALTLGLRQSEIAGLHWEDYDGKYLYIHRAVVPNKNNKYIEKETNKSYAGTRKIEVDGILKKRLDRAERKSEKISPMLPSSVLRKFSKLCEENGLPHFTMHSQRHGNASLMLKENVPDKYAMERLGQATPSMLKKVYQHTFKNEQEKISSKISEKFSEIYDQKHDQEN